MTCHPWSYKFRRLSLHKGFSRVRRSALSIKNANLSHGPIGRCDRNETKSGIDPKRYRISMVVLYSCGNNNSTISTFRVWPTVSVFSNTFSSYCWLNLNTTVICSCVLSRYPVEMSKPTAFHPRHMAASDFPGYLCKCADPWCAYRLKGEAMIIFSSWWTPNIRPRAFPTKQHNFALILILLALPNQAPDLHVGHWGLSSPCFVLFDKQQYFADHFVWFCFNQIYFCIFY